MSCKCIRSLHARAVFLLLRYFPALKYWMQAIETLAEPANLPSTFQAGITSAPLRVAIPLFLWDCASSNPKCKQDHS
jgi:hypothetical protein